MWISEDRVKKLCRRFDDRQHAHELTFSCYRKLPLLAMDATRTWLLEAIDRARATHELALWAFVVMPEHAHVIVFPKRPDYSISAVLKSIKQPVARKAINHLRKHAPDWLRNLEVRRGDGQVVHQFWEAGGGYDRNVRNVDTLWQMIDYVHLNPVRRGLAKAATDWEWSSARQYAAVDGVRLPVDDPAM
ncbi:MAG TPA: transposase [Humisphaera sp.]